MKSFLLLLFCCIFYSTSAQDAMSKMTEGIAAIQLTEYSNAKSIFKSGRKLARKSGQKDLKNRFKKMEDLASSYLKYQGKIEDAQKSIQSGKYLGALNDYMDAKQSLNAIAAFNTTELDTYNDGLMNELETSTQETEANRIERFETDLAEADKLFEAEQYSEASKAYAKVRQNSRKSENIKFGIIGKANQAKAWSNLQSGDRLLAKKRYRKALASYKKSKKAYALPVIEDKLAEATDAICSEIPTDIIGIIDLGKKEVDKLDGERMLFKYSCDPDRSKMIKNASKYFKIVGKAEKLEKTNKNGALEQYREAQKLAATDLVKQKINQLSPKAILAPVSVSTVTAPVSFALLTEIVSVDKSLGEFCPNRKDHKVSGNNEFGSGPFVNGKLDFTHDGKKVYVSITLELAAPNNGSKILAVWNKNLVYTSPKKITGFAVEGKDPSKVEVVRKVTSYFGNTGKDKSGHRTPLPTAGAEFMSCNEGKAYWLTDSGTISYEGNEMRDIKARVNLIGDTGGSDISDDRDCRCDAKIKKIEITGLQVQVER